MSFPPSSLYIFIISCLDFFDNCVGGVVSGFSEKKAGYVTHVLQWTYQYNISFILSYDAIYMLYLRYEFVSLFQLLMLWNYKEVYIILIYFVTSIHLNK